MKTTLKSPNLSGKQWIKRLEKNNYNIGNYAKELLNHKDFKATKNTYEIAIIKGSDMKENFTTQDVKDKAKELGYTTPPVELAPLLGENISDEELKEMDLWWLIVLHEPIADSGGGPSVLGVGRGDGGRWLDACCGGGGRALGEWGRGGGFVFLVPQDTQSSELGSLEQHSDTLTLESRVKDIEKKLSKIAEILTLGKTL